MAYQNNGPGYPQSGPGYPQAAPGYPQSGPVYPQAAPGYPQTDSGYPQPGSIYPQSTSGGPQYPPTTTPARMEAMESDYGADNLEFSDKSIRMAFIRKVYIILTLQLAVTFGLMSIIFFIPEVKQFVRENDAAWISAIVVNLVVFIALACAPNLRRKSPMNIIALFIFTLTEGYLLGAVCACLNDENAGEAIAKAIVVTIIIVVGLTAFAFQTKIDFTMMTGALCALTMGLLCFGLMALIFRSDMLYNVYAALGAVLFSMYIVVDTQLLIGGKHAIAISPEEYIFAALNLYLDIINLFLFLLRLFSE